MYLILPYSYKKAKELNVLIIPSKKLNKKIDVLDLNHNYICSIGDVRYNDFPNYIKKYGINYALERRRLYFLRHHKESDIYGTPSFFSRRILW